VAEVSGDCSADNAHAQLQARLKKAGWTLLNIVSVFDDSSLEERKDSAGENFLRY
jgi:hypothetical protein